MCAYNHEKYIGQAIEGVLKQKTNFKFRLIISDDCSSDNTRKVISEYYSKNSESMKVFFQEKNIGPYENSHILFEECKAKYIALCDGDDFWTDETKLQKQIDFLESNPDFVCCCHNADIISDGMVLRRYNDFNSPIILSRKDIIIGLSIPTASVVYRNLVKENPPKYLVKNTLDIILYFALYNYGKFFMFPDVMACYRIHNGGMWSGQSEMIKVNKSMEIQSYILKELPLNEEEKKAVSEVIVGLKLNRLKLFANQYRFGASFWRDFAAVARARLNGQEISIKYFLFCLIPSESIAKLQQIRGKKLINS